jgi:putative addiction module killer protein
VNIIQTTDTFDAWFDALKDRQAVLRIQTRIDRAENGNLGDVKQINPTQRHQNRAATGTPTVGDPHGHQTE